MIPKGFSETVKWRTDICIVWAHTTNLNPLLFIEMLVLNQECGRSCICVSVPHVSVCQCVMYLCVSASCICVSVRHVSVCQCVMYLCVSASCICVSVRHVSVCQWYRGFLFLQFWHRIVLTVRCCLVFFLLLYHMTLTHGVLIQLHNISVVKSQWQSTANDCKQETLIVMMDKTKTRSTIRPPTKTGSETRLF
jgi:hypothetical protein